MAKINKTPETTGNHLERLEQLDTVVEYLLGSCGTDTTVHQEAKLIKAKLERLKSDFGEGDIIEVSPHGMANRRHAKRQGYLIPLPSKDTLDEKEPVIEGRSIEEIAEQNRAIYELGQEVEELLKRVDGINKKADVTIDAYFIAKGLHKPALSNAPDFREILAKYPKKVRDKLKKLGMEALVHGSKVSRDDIEQTLKKSA